MTRALCVLVALASCGGGAHVLPSERARALDELTLYRDRAVVQHRVDVDVPEAVVEWGARALATAARAWRLVSKSLPVEVALP